jgi:hypothetical protein
MIAHVGPIPVEELVVAAVSGAGVALVAGRLVLARLRARLYRSD